MTVKLRDEYWGSSRELGQGLHAPWSVDISAVDEPGMDVDVSIHLTFDESERRMVVERLSASQRKGGPEISGTMLRTIPVAEMVTAGLQSLELRVETQYDGLVPYDPRAEAIAEALKTGPEVTSLRIAARIYMWAECKNLSPTKTVAEIMGMPYPTASNWVSRARKKEILV